jgi:twitching motility protein PilT
VTLEEMLTAAMSRRASDLLAMVGDSPAMRVAGVWQRFAAPPCGPHDVETLARVLLDEDGLARLRKARELDFSKNVPPAGRIRCNLHYQRDHLAMVLRLVWPEIPSAEKLGIPSRAIAQGDAHSGLILVSGPTGSGKSTTLAAMVEYINQNRPAHIITVEDPIEFMYANKRSIIEQREIGSDTRTWHSALRNVLRQAPDVIVLGELRDLESIQVALLAAETGHLVMASVHSSSAVGAVTRMIDVFPPSQIGQVRLQLSQSLRMIFAQRLVPGRAAETRALLYEVLMGTPAVANLIRSGELEQIPNMIGAGRDHGMISFAQCHRELLAQGRIAPDFEMH